MCPAGSGPRRPEVYAILSFSLGYLHPSTSSFSSIRALHCRNSDLLRPSKIKGSDITIFLVVVGSGVFVCRVERAETVVLRDSFSDHTPSTSCWSPWTMSHKLCAVA